MSFREQLESICQLAQGSLAVMVMSMDGIAVMKHEVQDPGLDMEVFLIEMVGPVRQAMQACESVTAGDMTAFNMEVGKGHLLFHHLVDEHFVALLMAPDAVVGRGRFALRLHSRALNQELS